MMFPLDTVNEAERFHTFVRTLLISVSFVSVWVVGLWIARKPPKS